MRIDRLMGVVAAVLAACDAGAGETPDAVDETGPDAPSYSCWPPIELVARGTAELGTGDNTFEPIGEELELPGGQGGFYLPLRMRMTGLTPGKPSDILFAGNPFTRVRAYLVDTGIPLSSSQRCGARFGYGPVDQAFETQVFPNLDACWRHDQLFGQRVRIELEVSDSTGSLATDTKTVTLVAPPGYVDPPIGEEAPGCEAP